MYPRDLSFHNVASTPLEFGTGFEGVEHPAFYAGKSNLVLGVVGTPAIEE